MSSTVFNITFDCRDAANVARFWAAVTGWDLRVAYENPDRVEFSVGPPPAGGVRLYFVPVPEPKTVKNRVHLDVIPAGGQRHELARLVELGASVADDQPADAGWVVMADPEGNEFCVEPGAG
ncbi:MAG TPA: VOC family protein [Streptosporangiaceae bacterium]|jgi:predicted enzyme related to lactoylglutathione lyase